MDIERAKEDNRICPVFNTNKHTLIDIDLIHLRENHSSAVE